jgi:6-phosphogluconolactonase
MKSTLLLILLANLFSQAYGQSHGDGVYKLLVGTYTKPGKSDGIYVYAFNSKTGEFSYKSEINGVKDPSFLTVSRDKKFVYAVNELSGGDGSVSAFSFDPATGQLHFLNSMGSGGNGPCYISVDDKNKFVFVGNYGGGSLSAIPINGDGSLGSDIQSFQHQGSSINKDQDKPHVHAAVLSEDNRYLFVPDLGTDKIYIYNVDVTKLKPLSPALPAFVSVKAGSGPRHFIFHPNGRFAYVIQELEGLITAFDYKNGKLNSIQTVSLLSSTYNGEKDAADAADIHISPDGKFLYGSLRSEINELVIYAIEADGQLTYVGRQSTLGKGPRNFAIDPSGNFILVGNSANDEIVIFSRNQQTGMLTPGAKKISVGAPVCLKFIVN